MKTKHEIHRSVMKIKINRIKLSAYLAGQKVSRALHLYSALKHLVFYFIARFITLHNGRFSRMSRSV